MHPLRQFGYLVPSWEEAIAARSAIIYAANSLFPDTVIGIWTKTQANPTDTHWDMLFQDAPETYTPNRENPNPEWGIYYYPDPNDRRIMNKVAEGPGKFIHPMERRLTYVLRDLLKVQGDKYDKTPTIYASVYGRQAGDGGGFWLRPKA